MVFDVIVASVAELWAFVFRGASPWEVFGVLFGLISVWLTVKQNVWCWPTGIVNASLFLVMFYQTRLYADTGLQSVYVVLSIYGWWKWLHPGRGRTQLPVSRFTARGWIVAAAIAIAGTAALGGFFATHTDAAFPYLDSMTTVMSLIAQWMLTRKILENWAIWISADVVMIAMYCYKGLYFTGALYAVFIGMCVAGWIEWKRSPAVDSSSENSFPRTADIST